MEGKLDLFLCSSQKLVVLCLIFALYCQLSCLVVSLLCAKCKLRCIFHWDQPLTSLSSLLCFGLCCFLYPSAFWMQCCVEFYCSFLSFRPRLYITPLGQFDVLQVWVRDFLKANWFCVYGLTQFPSIWGFLEVYQHLNFLTSQQQNEHE